MISLPDKSDFANLREHTIELSSLGGGGVNSYKGDTFPAASCEHRRCLFLHTKVMLTELGQGDQGKEL